MEVINDADGWVVRLQHERSFYTRLDGTIGRSAATIFQGDKPICCFGAVVMSGIASVWMRVIENPPIFIYRIVKRLLKDFLDNSDMRRAETVIALDRPTNHKFIHALGFEIEGKADNYFPGMTGVRWAWIRR